MLPLGLFSKCSECPLGTKCYPRSEDKHTGTRAQFLALMNLEVQPSRHIHIQLGHILHCDECQWSHI